MTDLPHRPRQSFAASNSAEGFVNYYGEIFTDQRVDRLHIIKGGPGTGKSHFMKETARRARSLGYTVTEYFCSSDPLSLDGLLLERAGAPTVGFLDGTAPHAREPVLPGAREELINLGAFWDPAKLMGQKDVIRDLGAAKSAAYSRAYRALAAAGEMDALAELLLEDCVDTEGLSRLAARILKDQPKGGGFSREIALRCAVSMSGRHTLHSYEAAAEGYALILPDNRYGLGYRFMDALLACSREKGLRVCVSPHPVYPRKTDGILYPDTGLCVLVGDALPPEGIPTRHLSLRRYTDKEAMRRLRGELRQAEKLKETLTQSALRHLKTASDAHFRLERIYADAMNFSAKEAFTERFCGVVLGER
jgi:hypothetical protein